MLQISGGEFFKLNHLYQYERANSKDSFTCGRENTSQLEQQKKLNPFWASSPDATNVQRQ
jgi:hypothetical protein